MAAQMVASDARGLASKAGVEFAASLFGFGQQPPKRRGHRIRGVTAFSVPRPQPNYHACSSSAPLPGMNGIDVSSICVEKRDCKAASSSSSRVEEMLAGVPVTRSFAPPSILWLDNAAQGQPILKVRAMD
ncbi:hypothetical protein [Mycobacterium lepromatosis]|uniref:hypothetical protein n=1 Tax=Mycobacterium lepromatosis TaxID=480418 RepID=UPI000679856A